MAHCIYLYVKFNYRASIDYYTCITVEINVQIVKESLSYTIFCMIKRKEIIILLVCNKEIHIISSYKCMFVYLYFLYCNGTSKQDFPAIAVV